MPGTILVTGAAGFAGSHLLDLLAADTADIVAWRRPGNTPVRTLPGTRWEEVDLLDAAAVTTAISRIRPSAVYHCAGAAHVGRSWDATWETFATNVHATHYLLEALERTGSAARVMIPSSALVYAPSAVPLTEEHAVLPDSPYGLSKLAQEMLGERTSGSLTVTIARSFNHFGPRQDPQFVASGFARRIAEIEKGRCEAEIAVGNLEAHRDLTDVRDTVRAYRLILERGQARRHYNVCSGRAIAIRRLLDLLIVRARVAVRVTVDPARYRPNDARLLVGNAARLHTELGWTPAISLEQTLDDLLEYWRAQP
ncbi:MAG TPA: GDP-mannose 4,6-dehydratase [Vicinamibacterales bacterium]|jgi:GDP-4-dehydro-6-deoxy-D-mannose reductase